MVLLFIFFINYIIIIVIYLFINSMSDIYYSLNDQKLFLEFEFIEYDLKKYIDTLPKHVNVPIEIIKVKKLYFSINNNL